MKWLWYRNVEFIKNNILEFVSQMGFSIIGREGALGDLWWGGRVFYILKRPENPELAYRMEVFRTYDGVFSNQLYVFNPEAKITQITSEVS